MAASRRKLVFIATAALLVASAGTWAVLRATRASAVSYRHTPLERGDIASSISATGTLGAVTTVQVGTQVSGQVAAIYADFNAHVKKGQLIARIDATLQQQAVREAEAGLARNSAEFAKATVDHTRSTELRQRDVISDADLELANYSYAVAAANVASGQVALDRARRNLSYTSIHAPIDGIVIERNVDVGQTVAASLSAPQLFLIANDLARMQILAPVDESDIAAIIVGMPVTFTVQSDARTTFSGVVRQRRLQSSTSENVVSYMVVVEVANPDGVLLPGMTATVAFLTATATAVLLVPNAALRLRATPAMEAAAAKSAQGASPGSSSADQPESGAKEGATRPAGGRSSSATRGTTTTARGLRELERIKGARGNVAGVLWYLDAAGRIASLRVRVGITDGQRTQVSGAGLVAGMPIVISTGASSASTTASAAPTSPFQQQRPSGGPGGRGGF